MKILYISKFYSFTMKARHVNLLRIRRFPAKRADDDLSFVEFAVFRQANGNRFQDRRTAD